MGRQAQEEVAAAARRRLELLGRELDQAGLRRIDAPPPVVDRPAEDPTSQEPALPEPSPVRPVGRHARAARPQTGRRLRGWRLKGWVGDHVPDTLRGRVGLEPASVVLIVALVALAVTAAAYVVLRAGGGSEAVPAASSPTASPSALLPALASGGSSPSGSTATAPIPSGDVTVDVAGKVRRPGVTTLPAGSRVVDALRRAGGARGGVDLSGLNLARVLVDGEQVVVGRAGVPGAPSGPQPGASAAGASTAAPDATGALVNLNVASLVQLETLPGVGPVTAQKIIDWRTAHGAFSSVDELLEIDGIGEKTLAELAPHATL